MESSKYDGDDLEQSSSEYAINPVRTAAKKAKAVFVAAFHARQAEAAHANKLTFTHFMQAPLYYTPCPHDPNRG